MSGVFKRLSDYGFKTANNTYIIAEIGINHGGNLEAAKRLIESAVRAGVDAVKFQTYITEKRTFQGSPIFNILKECELPFSAFATLKKCAEDLGTTFFSTPFDEESVQCLEDLNCDLYKIASFDVTNKKFLRLVAATGRPVILSVGMADRAEVKGAYETLREGTKKIGLLHCISAYPTQAKDANLGAVLALRQQYDCVIGQSDHTNDIQVPLFAVAAGAQILEKHFMIDRASQCVDGPVSITEEQMSKLVAETRRLEKIMGDGESRLTPAQEGAKIFRRVST